MNANLFSIHKLAMFFSSFRFAFFKNNTRHGKEMFSIKILYENLTKFSWNAATFPKIFFFGKQKKKEMLTLATCRTRVYRLQRVNLIRKTVRFLRVPFVNSLCTTPAARSSRQTYTAMRKHRAAFTANPPRSPRASRRRLRSRKVVPRRSNITDHAENRRAI